MGMRHWNEMLTLSRNIIIIIIILGPSSTKGS